MPTRRLLAVLQAIREHLPEVERVSSYCLPRNLRRKSVEELRELADAGLRMAYVGAESGDDEVLARVNKGETYSSTLDALEKLGEAGISRSVMILNGLGGMTLSAQHADNSARLMNAAQPEYLSTLVVSFPTGEQRFRAGFADFEALDRRALFVEVERLLQGLELEDTVFRSDHASNYLVLKGELGADKARLLAEVRQAIEQPQHAPCARSGSVACDGAEAASARHSPVFRRRQGDDRCCTCSVSPWRCSSWAACPPA